MNEAAPTPPPAPAPGAPDIPTELARDMGLVQVVMIGIGAMIGAGIFVLTGIAAAFAGPALILVFVLNGLVTALTALSYAELGSCFPEAGGGYLWVKEALPQPSGFLSGWMSWFAHSVACSLYAVAFGSFAIEFARVALGLDLAALPPFGGDHALAARGLAVLVIAAFCAVNYRGAQETGRAETLVTSLKMVVIGLFVLFGLAILATTTGWGRQLHPFLPLETLSHPGPGAVFSTPALLGLIAAMGLTFIAFEGYEIIAQCGEEVQNPKRNIPRAIFISLAVVVPTYVLVAFVAITAIPQSVSGGQPNWVWLGSALHAELAMSDAANAIFPGSAHHVGEVVFLLGGMLSTVSALNATVYSSARVSFAMGRDHNLPAVFARVHPTRRTPHVAVVLSGLLIAAVAVALPVEDLASATDVLFLFLFVLVNVALINLRRFRPELDRGFRVPWVPLLPTLAVVLNLGMVAVLFTQIPLGSTVSGLFIVAGLLVYLAYARRRELEAVATPVLYEEAPPVSEGDYRVLTPVANPRNLDVLMQVASRVAQYRHGSVVALNVLQVPAQLPPSAGRQFLEARKALLAEAVAFERELGVPVRAAVKVGHRVSQAVLEAARQYHARLLVLGWRGRPPRTRDRVLGDTLDEVLLQAETDVLVVRRAPTRPPERIVVPIASVRYAKLSLEVARAFQAWSQAPILVLHVTSLTGKSDVLKAEIQEGLARDGHVGEGAPIDVRVIEAPGVAAPIIRATRSGDLLIMGAPQEGLWRRALSGDIPHRVMMAVDVPALLTKTYVGRVRSWLQMLLGRRKPLLH